MEMRPLEVDLAEEEVEAKSRELGRATLDERAQESALERAGEEWKATKKDLEKALRETRGRARRLAEEVTSRKATRDVPCDWNYDLDSKSKILVRRDTGAAVERQKMTPQEAQLKIGETLQEATEEQLKLWQSQLGEAWEAASRESPPGEPQSGDQLPMPDGEEEELEEEFGPDPPDAEPPELLYEDDPPSPKRRRR